MKIKKAFTLIELLVVIAIIAILAAILFPVFAAAREKARQTQCASNEKQLGLAFVQYMQDFDECPPQGVNNGSAGVHAGEGWAGQIYPYVKSTGVFACPDDFTNISVPNGFSRVSYIYNTGSDYNYPQTNYSHCTTLQAVSAIGEDTMYPLGKYNAPANTVLLAEGRLPGSFVITAPEQSYAQNSNAETSPIGIPGNDPPQCNNGNGCSGTNPSYGFATGPIGGFVGGGSYPNVYYYEPGSSYTTSPAMFGVHSNTGANWLFFDGHVKWLTPSKISGGFNNATAGDCGTGGGSGTQQAANTQCGTYAGTYSIL